MIIQHLWSFISPQSASNKELVELKPLFTTAASDNHTHFKQWCVELWKLSFSLSLEGMTEFDTLKASGVTSIIHGVEIKETCCTISLVWSRLSVSLRAVSRWPVRLNLETVCQKFGNSTLLLIFYSSRPESGGASSACSVKCVVTQLGKCTDLHAASENS